MAATITVAEFPPKDSCNSLIQWQNRIGRKGVVDELDNIVSNGKKSSEQT